MPDCIVDSDVSLVLGVLHVCGHADVRSHVSPGMDRSFLQLSRVLNPFQDKQMKKNKNTIRPNKDNAG